MPFDPLPFSDNGADAETNLRLAINSITTDMLLSNVKVFGFMKRVADINKQKVSSIDVMITLHEFIHESIIAIAQFWRRSKISFSKQDLIM